MHRVDAMVVGDALDRRRRRRSARARAARVPRPAACAMLLSGAMIPLTRPPFQLTVALGFFDQPTSTLIPGPSAPVAQSTMIANSRARRRDCRRPSRACRQRAGSPGGVAEQRQLVVADRRRREGDRRQLLRWRYCASSASFSCLRGWSCQSPSADHHRDRAAATIRVGISGSRRIDRSAPHRPRAASPRGPARPSRPRRRSRRTGTATPRRRSASTRPPPRSRNAAAA